MTGFRWTIGLMVVLGLAACSKDSETPHPTTAGVAAPAPTTPPVVDPTAMNKSVDPCTDFYEYACGTWEKDFKLPAGYSRLMRADYVITRKTDQLLQTVLENFARGEAKPDVPFHKQMGDYYATCLDDTKAEKSAREILPRELEAIDAAKDKTELGQVQVALFLKGIDSLFGFGSGQDFADATQVIGQLAPGGMALPRDYYLNEKKADIRAKYQAHVAKMLELAGVAKAEAAKQAVAVLAIETALATAQLKPEDERDPKQTYHPMDATGLVSAAPGFDWNAFFAGVGVTPKKINVSEPTFVAASAAIFRDKPLADLKAYMKWHYVHAAADALGQAFFDENFDFFGKTLTGKKAPFPKTKRCVDAVTGAMAFALGRAYTDLAFSKESKDAASNVVEQIRQAFAENLETLSWMDPATRDAARHKLSTINKKIGYPDKAIDYSTLVVGRSSTLENVLGASRFAVVRDLNKINHPVDRSEWGMYPHEINAYYSPNLNEIAFPAAILQPPYFNLTAPLAHNFGSTGATMGHELTHGFDDEGRQYDAQGNLKEWWTPEVEKQFTEKAQCLVNQYSGYTVSNGDHVNGRLTLGENIADLGGLKLAHAAYKTATAGHAPAPEIAGLDEEQQFFVAFAQSWCSKATPETLIKQVVSDPHLPEKFRVNGSVTNVPEFQKAFSCPAGAPLAPKNRCEIW